jgi:putative peptidoglycan lipid II flippase
MTQQTSFIRVLAVVFSGTLAVQLIAFLRQLVIAAAFGTERAMDIYLLVFSIAAVIGFGLGTVMENATVPLLVNRLEKNDREGFGQIGLRVIVIGFGLGIAAAILFMLAVPFVARFVTRGLSGTEREMMRALSWWFIPWIVISVPYYAIGSLLKAESRFRRFMLAEVIVTIASLLIILVWCPGVHAIAIAYGAGYGIALLSMVPGLPVPFRFSQRASGQSWGVVRQITRFAAVSQVSTLGLLVDRFLASYLPSGAIAATSYASLMTGQVSALLGFRDAFMVPLSGEHGRERKLERMITGLLMLAIPCAMFLSLHAEAVVSILLERGKFDRSAVTLAAAVLALQAAALPVSVILLPMYRMLQILGRMRFAGYLLLISAGMTLLIGSSMMFGLKLGLTGYLLTSLIVAHLTCLVVIVQLRLAGIRLNLVQPLAFALYASAAAVAGIWAGKQLIIDAPPVFRLLKDGLVFSCVYALACLAIRTPLRRIVVEMRAS